MTGWVTGQSLKFRSTAISRINLLLVMTCFVQNLLRSQTVFRVPQISFALHLKTNSIIIEAAEYRQRDLRIA